MVSLNRKLPRCGAASDSPRILRWLVIVNDRSLGTNMGWCVLRRGLPRKPTVALPQRI